MVFGRVRERARERREEPGESEREQGGGVASSRGIEARRGGQAGRERGGVARWRARAPATLPSLCRDEDDRGGRWAGPASWLGCTGRSPGKLLPLFIFFF